MRINCFAGPNGSGKTTTFDKVKNDVGYKGVLFINADVISKMSDQFNQIKNDNDRNMAASVFADKLKLQLIKMNRDFVFETVLSTPRNLKLLEQSKKQGAIIDCIYVLTRNPDINVRRVSKRVQQGGHSVPEQKIRDRYERCMKILPELIEICDIVKLIDNTEENKPKILFEKNINTYKSFTESIAEYEFLKEKILIPLGINTFKNKHCKEMQYCTQKYLVKAIEGIEDEMLEASENFINMYACLNEISINKATQIFESKSCLNDNSRSLIEGIALERKEIEHIAMLYESLQKPISSAVRCEENIVLHNSECDESIYKLSD